MMNRVFKGLRECSVKLSARSVNIQTLFVAAQAFPLQPLPEHPKIIFDPLKNSHPRQKFIYKFIELWILSLRVFMSFVCL